MKTFPGFPRGPVPRSGRRDACDLPAHSLRLRLTGMRLAQKRLAVMSARRLYGPIHPAKKSSAKNNANRGSR